MYSFNRSKTVVNSTVKKSIKDLPIAKLAQDWDDAYAEAIAKSVAAIEAFKKKHPNDEPPTLDKAEAKKFANAKVEEFANSWGMKTMNWFWPQALAHIATWQVDTFDGMYDPKSLLVKNCKDNMFNKGLYRLCMYTKRSDLIGTQSSGDNRYYCTLVPLILAAFKKFNGVKYSQWRSEGLELIVEEKLYEAMHQVLEESPESILEARDIGLKIKSGTKAGELRSPTSTYMLYGVGHTVLKELNGLGQVMYTQIWCAHPSNRNEYMILDPKDWDGMPDTLIESNPISPSPRADSTAPVNYNVSDIDW